MVLGVVRRWTMPAAARRRPLVVAVQVLTLGLALAFSLTTLPGVRDPVFDPWVDGWLQAAGYVAAAVLVALRPALCAFDRGIWSLVAAGLALRAAAFVVYLSWVRTQRPQPYPSLADAGWLGMCVLVLAALVLLARSRFHGLSLVIVLDAVVAAAATASLALAVLSDPVRDLSPSGTPRAAVAVNVLYPAFDALLLVVVLGVLLAYGWNPPPGMWLFGAGVAGFAVLDSAYLYAVARGTWHPGTPLAALSLVATTVIALSAWAPPGRPNRGRRDQLPVLVLPAVLGGVCLAELVWATSHDLPGVVVLLALTGLLAAVVRTARSFAQVRALVRAGAPEEVLPRSEMLEALERRQLVLHYQPQVSLVDGRVVGVEALVRWRHPTAGLLGPLAFLPQFERAGLSQRLTDLVLDVAVQQVAAWWRTGRRVTCSVNLSATDLLGGDLAGKVGQVLREHGVPGGALVLELTEDVLLVDPERGQQVIADLLAQGVRVHVDDYGTGYSSLGYLRDLPQLGGLKLDRSFVTHLDQDQRSVAIVSSTIGLARSLGVDLVAEGVETVEVRDRLRALGCDLAQGYLFGRPVPAGEVAFDAVAAAVASP